MWSKNFCFEAVDLFVRGYECGDGDRESVILAGLNVASHGPPEVRGYLDDRVFEADRRVSTQRGEVPTERATWTLGVSETQFTSLGLRTIAQMAAELHREVGGLRREIQRQAKERGLTRVPDASFTMGFVRVYRFCGTWLCRAILEQRTS